jgi:integrase
MPKLKDNQVPAYRLHKQSGQAIVTLSGRDHLLGPHGSKVSREKYDRLIAEWLSNGRRGTCRQAQGITVSRVVVEFWAHAKAYYVNPAGGPSNELENLRQALIPLRGLYGATVAAEFGPRALKAVQQEMIRLGWARTHINRQVARLKHVFKWAVGAELIPGSIHQALVAVAGLRKGKSEARESEPVKPVPEGWVELTLPHVSPQVEAMIRLQLLTGMRPGEVVILRGCDIDTGGKVWLYRPHYHKREHHGLSRDVRIGPKGQEVIRPFLKPDLHAYLFSPADAEAARYATKPNHRRRPADPATSDRRLGARYNVTSYRRAIARGCDLAFPLPAHLARRRVPAHGRKKKSERWESRAEWRARLGKSGWAGLLKWREAHRWHPHQLRHTAATRLRREYGIEAARVILGHQSAAVTQIYAEADVQKATQIMGEVG